MKSRWLFLVAMVALVGCRLPVRNNIPPADQLMHPGPGVDGPGPGVMMGAMPGAPIAHSGAFSQIAFQEPEGMTVCWEVAPGDFNSEQLICPGRYSFQQGPMYRLKFTNIPGREDIVLYPTLEIAPSTPRTEAYLAHSIIPVEIQEEDLDQVTSGNFVTKVIYLPDQEFQELALAGVDTLVSTRLNPGEDPIVEADHRGSILAILRIGNKDLEVPGEEQPMGGMDAGMYPQDGMPPQFVSGMSAPQYGMPMTGTPIGLPGPPHIPLGGPAGLQKHVIRNHTINRIPGPTKNVKIDVMQRPGYNYPKPPSRAIITESTHAPPVRFTQPLRDNVNVVE